MARRHGGISTSGALAPIRSAHWRVEMFSSNTAIISKKSEEIGSFFAVRAKEHSCIRRSNRVVFTGYSEVREKNSDSIDIMAELLENISPEIAFCLDEVFLLHKTQYVA